MARESWKNGPSCSGVAKRIPGHRASLLHALYFQAFGKQNLGRKVSPSLYTHKICPSNKIGQTPRTDWNRFKSWRVFILFGAMFYVSVCLRIGYWIPQKLIQFDGLSVIIVLHLRGIPKIYPCIGIPNDGTPLPLSRKGVSSPIGPRPRIPLRCSWGNQGKNHRIWWWKELETSVFRGVNPYSSGTKAMWRTT